MSSDKKTTKDKKRSLQVVDQEGAEGTPAELTKRQTRDELRAKLSGNFKVCDIENAPQSIVASGDGASSAAAIATSEPEPWMLGGVIKGFKQRYTFLAKPSPNTHTVYVDDGRVLMWSVPRTKKEVTATTGPDAKKTRKPPAVLTEESRLSTIPQSIELSTFFSSDASKGPTSLKEAKAKMKKHTKVILERISCEHVPKLESGIPTGEMRRYMNGSATYDLTQTNVDRGGRGQPMRAITALLASPYVSAKALRDGFSLVGNGEFPDMFEQTLNGETAARDTIIAKFNAVKEASECQILNALLSPPLPNGVLLSGADANQLCYVSDSNQTTAIVVTPFKEGSCRSYTQAMLGQDLGNRPIFELAPTLNIGNPEKPNLKFALALATPDMQASTNFGNAGDPSGFLRTAKCAAVIAVPFQLQVAAAHLGTDKRPYLITALNELYPVLTMGLFMNRGFGDGPQRTSNSDGVVPKFPAFNEGIVFDAVTTVVRGGVEVSVEFLTHEFKIPEGEMDDQHGGVSGEEWVAASVGEDDIIVHSEHSLKIDKQTFRSGGLCNLRQDAEYLSKLAKDSPYSSQSTKKVTYFVVTEGSVEMADTVRNNVYDSENMDESMSALRKVKCNMGEQLLLAKAGANGVRNMVNSVFGSVYAVDASLVDESVSIFGCDGL